MVITINLSYRVQRVTMSGLANKIGTLPLPSRSERWIDTYSLARWKPDPTISQQILSYLSHTRNSPFTGSGSQDPDPGDSFCSLRCPPFRKSRIYPVEIKKSHISREFIALFRMFRQDEFWGNTGCPGAGSAELILQHL